jgi:hypothetical protein
MAQSTAGQLRRTHQLILPGLPVLSSARQREGAKVQVLISWSGQPSKEIALALHGSIDGALTSSAVSSGRPVWPSRSPSWGGATARGQTLLKPP